MNEQPAVVEAPAETRVGAAAELGGDDVGLFVGGRAHVAHDVGARLSFGAEVAWAWASWSRTTFNSLTTGATGDQLLADRQKGRALWFVALRTAPGQAEAAIAVGCGIGGERRAEEFADGSTMWRAIVPSFAGGAWGSGRVWIASFLAIEIEAGVIVTNEPRDTYDTTHYRAVPSPFGRGGLVARFF